MNTEQKKEHHGKKLKIFLKKRGITVVDFAKTLEISSQGVYNLYSKDEFSISQIATFCKILPLEPDFFGRNPKVFETYRNDSDDTSLFLSYERERSKSKSSAEEVYQDFLSTYFDEIIKRVENAQESILIVDYLNDNWYIEQRLRKDKGKQSLYRDKYIKYLSTISSTIANRKKEGIKNFKYERIFQRPLTISPLTQLAAGNIKSKKYNEQESGLYVVMDLILDTTIKHLEEMYGMGYKDFEVRWIDIPIRPNSYLIIDDEVLITEYLKFNKNGKHLPDMLFIESTRSAKMGRITKQLIDAHKTQLERVKRKTLNNIIQRERALDILYQIEEALHEELESCTRILNEQNELYNTQYKNPNHYLLRTISSLETEVKRIQVRLSYTKSKIDSFRKLKRKSQN